MLCNMKEMLASARKGKYAIGAFNTPNLETLRAVIDAAEELDTPVILDHAEAHQPFADIKAIGPLMVHYAKKAKVPVCVHLDHGTDRGYLLNAIKLGFTSVMYDCSAMSFEDNAREIAALVKDAHLMDITVEAELGHMPGDREGGCSTSPTVAAGEGFTEVDEAKRFIEMTGVDALAISFGSVHCVNKDNADVKLDIDHLKKIRAVSGDCALVLHGGSGVPDAQIRQAISNGICKINYYTYMAIAPAPAIAKLIAANPDMLFYHDIANLAQKIINDRCKDAIRVFLNK